jgi:protein phosphatase
MGGHAGGEIASRLAVETIEAFVSETVDAHGDSTWPFPYDPALSRDANRLNTAFRLANRRLAAESARQFMLRGMATTASCLLASPGPRATAGHVGDSRIYCLRGGVLSRLSQDHSWVEEQVRAGILEPSAAPHHPWRNVVTRALAGGDDLKVDIFEVQLEAGDRLLVCSDGLFSVVEDEAIAAALGDARRLDDACERLVEAANAAGGPDNITVLALEVHAA